MKTKLKLRLMKNYLPTVVKEELHCCKRKLIFTKNFDENEPKNDHFRILQQLSSLHPKLKKPLQRIYHG